MNASQQRSDTLFAASYSFRIVCVLILTAAGVLCAAIQCAAGNYRNAALSAVAGLGLVFLFAARISVQTILITWFVTTPLASFYIRFPLDRSIVTYNRGIFVLVVVMLLLKEYAEHSSRRSQTSVTSGEAHAPAIFSLSRFEIAWVLLSVLALGSCVAQSENFGFAAHIAIDTFWLPLIAFHVTRNNLDPRKIGKPLVLAGIVLALSLFAIGAVEFMTGTDLFAYKGSEIFREGERRVNGPFATDSSFAIISLLLFLFLLVAPRVFKIRFDRTGKLAYRCALVAAALSSLLPLFRGVALALAGCWILLQWLKHNKGGWSSIKPALRRRLPVGALIIAMLIALGGWFAASFTSLPGGRLTEARTVYGRLATWQAAAEIIIDNPVFGVGLANYAAYFDKSHYYSDEEPEEILETRAADSPHSNVLWIGAEMGVIGLALYLAANVYLFLMGWRSLKRATTSGQRAAAACFLAILAAYWIPGLTLASGYYSDLNLYFFFLLGALSRLAGRPEPQADSKPFQPAHGFGD